MNCNRIENRETNIFVFYRGRACCVLKIESRIKVMKHPLATEEASDGKRPPRSAGATGRLFLPAPARRLSLSGSLGWAGAAPKPHAGSSDGDTAIELLRELVTLVVLESSGRQRGMKNWVCDGVDCFGGAADGLGCAKGLRRSCCDCSGGPTSRNGDFSPLKQPTTPHKYA